MSAPFSFADPVYQVSGTLQFIGNSGCDPSVCTETINFKFGLAPYVVDDTIYAGFYAISLNTTGPLSDLGFGDPGESFNGPNFVEDIKSFVGGSCNVPQPQFCTEIDFGYILQKTGSTYSLPSLGAEWFTCEATCGQYFTADGKGGFGFGSGGAYTDLTVENVTFSQVPEPPVALSVALGGICTMLVLSGRMHKLICPKDSN